MPTPPPLQQNEPAHASPAPRTQKAQTVAVPRAWLVLLTILSVAPWLVLGVIRLWPGSTVTSSELVSRPTTGGTGAWGQLILTPITISPPLEYVPRDWGPVQSSAWTFPNMAVDQAADFLLRSGMAPGDVDTLRATVRPTRPVNGVSFTPSSEIVRRLTAEARAAIYMALARAAVKVDRNVAPINYDQFTAYRYYGATGDDWLNGITPATRALVEPYLYREAGFLFFADIERIRPAITDPQELQRLVKRLLRQQTLVVQLELNDPARVDAITEYWGRGGRRTDIRPLLESVARFSESADDSQVAIDVSHLLPTLARQLLYRYPKVTVADEERPLLANCLWTALNFFNQQADDRYLDVAFALNRLKEDYFLVHDGFQLGDIVAFTDPEGTLVHVAVYLADDLIFSKNGTSALAPWSILPIDRLKGHYAENADRWRATYHRRKDL
jgi:hypothetical protein